MRSLLTCAVAWALTAASVPAGEGAAPPKGAAAPAEAKPAENPEMGRKVQQLVDELVSPPVAEPDAGAAKDIAALIVKFGSADFETREAASKAILKHQAAALGSLRRALDHQDQEVVERASQAIAAIGSGARAAVCGKVKALGEAGRREIARQLAAATAEIAALAAAKKPEDQKAREAEEAARRAKAAAVWKRVAALAEMQGAAWGLTDESAEAGSQPARLMMVLRDKDVEKRIAAIWMLGVMELSQPNACVPFMGHALHDQDAKVRQALAWAIGLSGQASGGTGQAFLQVLSQNANDDIRKVLEAVKELPRQ